MKKSLLLVSLSSLLLGTSCSSDDNNNATPVLQPSVGAVLQPLVGGSTQPNQVFVDLSTENTQQINRGSWDLGFYSGTEFRVVINGSVQMAVKNSLQRTLPNLWRKIWLLQWEHLTHKMWLS
jgi:hypothetical protein